MIDNTDPDDTLTNLDDANTSDFEGRVAHGAAAERPVTSTTSSFEPDDEVEATRAGIEQTRSNIGGTLDAIKDKLDPKAMMDHAKETVHDVVADVTSHAKETAKEAVTGAVGGVVDEAKEVVGGAVDTVKGAGSTVIDLVKRNPMPAALIGLGGLWLYLLQRDQQMGARQRMAGMDSGDRDHLGGPIPTVVQDTLSNVSQKVGDVAGNAKDWAGDAVNSTVSYSQDLGTATMEIVRNNPIPIALTGVGIAWVLLNQRNQASQSSQPQKRNLGNTYYDSRGQIRRRPGQPRQDSGNNSIADTASEWTDKAKEWGSQALEEASSTVSSTATRVQSSFMSNPLPIGIALLGLGAAAGMLIPSTQVENQWMGETKERLADQAKDKVQDVVSKVQTVAEHTYDTAKETVQQEAKNQGLTAESGQTEQSSPNPSPA